MPSRMSRAARSGVVVLRVCAAAVASSMGIVTPELAVMFVATAPEKTAVTWKLDRAVLEVLQLRERLNDPGAMHESIDDTQLRDHLRGQGLHGCFVRDVEDVGRNRAVGRGQGRGLLQRRRVEIDCSDSPSAEHGLERHRPTQCRCRRR
jgi:hypothetical protein